MNRLWSVLGVVALVVASAAVPAFGLVSDGTTSPQQTTTTTPTDGDGTNATESANATAPGARLAGVVGVQGAEIGGELESRRFRAQLDAAATNDSKATVVAAQADRSRARLSELEAELDGLQAARENGSISADQYRARAARLSARLQAVERVSNRTAAAADRLPPETLERNGVNVTDIRRLRTDASELSGPEVAEAARTIAGANAGRGFGPPESGQRGERGERGRSGEQGPPEEPGERGRNGSAAGPDDGASTANETDGTDDAGRGHGPPDERGRSDDADRGSPGGQGPEGDDDGSNETRGNSSAEGGSDSDNGPPSDAGSGGADDGRPDDAGGNDDASERSRSADGSDA